MFQTGNNRGEMGEFKGVVMKSAEGNVGYLKGKVARKPRITTAIMEKMQERRKWKNKNTEEGTRTYRRLNNELRRETDQESERWWENLVQRVRRIRSKSSTRFSVCKG